MTSATRAPTPDRAPVPVTLVIGTSWAAGAEASERLRRIERQYINLTGARPAEAWVWLSQRASAQALPVHLGAAGAAGTTGTAGSPDKEGQERTTGTPGATMRLTSACLCCGGNLEMQLQLDRLLQDPLPARLVLELSPGSHLSGMLDVLRSARWRERLDVQQIIMAARDPMPAAARTRLQAATQLLLFDPCESMSELAASLSTRPFANELPILNFTGRSLANADTPMLMLIDDSVAADDLLASMMMNQSATRDTSWTLRSTANTGVQLDAHWPATMGFDRRQLLSAFKAIDEAGPQVTCLEGQAVFATARDWYHWRCDSSGATWHDTHYRVINRLRIDCSDDETSRQLLEQLRRDIENATLI